MTKNYEQADRVPSPPDTHPETDKTIFVPRDSDHAAGEQDHLEQLKSATIMMVDYAPT